MRTALGRLNSILLTGAMIFAIAVVDQASGVELRVYPLYFVPIGFAAWRLPPRVALIVPALATGAWMWSNVMETARAGSPIWLANSATQAVAFLFVSVLMTELRRRLVHERNLSRRDRLTGLANSLAFYEAGAQLIANASRARRPITIAYVDLDNFKAVNDTRGHLEGDRVLQAVAGVLARELRLGDLAARLGGDEFALVLPNCDAEGATLLLERVRRTALQEMRRSGWPVSFSIGALAYSRAPASLQQAIQAADALMYAAKRGGKDRVHVRPVAASSNPSLAATGSDPA